MQAINRFFRVFWAKCFAITGLGVADLPTLNRESLVPEEFKLIESLLVGWAN